MWLEAENAGVETARFDTNPCVTPPLRANYSEFYLISTSLVVLVEKETVEVFVGFNSPAPRVSVHFGNKSSAEVPEELGSSKSPWQTLTTWRYVKCAQKTCKATVRGCTTGASLSQDEAAQG
jgi:hypothetical protein